MSAICMDRHPPKETAPARVDGAKAGVQSKQANSSREELDDAMGECRMLRVLQDRLARFNAYLYPLCGEQLLLSQPGGLTRTVPDLRAARQLLKQWEAR
ncbi:MAG: hypothetical protein JWP60_3350 [Ramlibacter sp.]|nr:hypothetical protein [Ramlibacter sp.]